MAYESMHNVFVGMISFMTVGGVCNFFLIFFFMLLYESVIIQKVRDITDWWISDQALHCVLNHVFHVSILYTKANRRWNCTVFQPWCNDCSLSFCFVLFLLLQFGSIKMLSMWQKSLFLGRGKLLCFQTRARLWSLWIWLGYYLNECLFLFTSNTLSRL